MSIPMALLICRRRLGSFGKLAFVAGSLCSGMWSLLDGKVARAGWNQGIDSRLVDIEHSEE